MTSKAGYVLLKAGEQGRLHLIDNQHQQASSSGARKKVYEPMVV